MSSTDMVGLAVNPNDDGPLSQLIGQTVTFRSQHLYVVADVRAYPGQIMPIYDGTDKALDHRLKLEDT